MSPSEWGRAPLVPSLASALLLSLGLGAATGCAAGAAAAGGRGEPALAGARAPAGLEGPAGELDTETSTLAELQAGSSTSGFALTGSNEAPDLELLAERAREAEAIDRIEAGGEPKIRSILAVTGTVSFDIPMTEHERVDDWMAYFLGPGRKWYEVWLSRSTRYVPIFREILERHGLPRDLIFLAMIESGFAPNAYSWAHAAGPWQFITFTGKRYGLAIDFWVDERRDFERATEAAAKYLKKLYGQFGDWYLAWAAYNAGEGRVELAIRKTGTRDFWKLTKTRWLRRETRHYVPKLLAAAVVAKQPERFGFEHVEYQAPLRWEVLTVTTAVDLATLAKACGAPVLEADLKALNPALRRGVTPPGRSYTLRVPDGRGEGCQLGLRSLPAEAQVTYRYHRVQRGETPGSIAKLYHTTPEAILRFNNLEGKRLKRNADLVVPIPAGKERDVPLMKAPDGPPEAEAVVPEGQKFVVHRVRPGDSLWTIARRYRVDVQRLRQWNGLWKNTPLRIGQAIRIYGGRPS